MTYKIYQTDPHTCDYTFEWWSWAKDRFNFKDYKLIYEDVVIPNEGPIENTLEELFELFNKHRPTDFNGHSLSVSDVVELDDKFYYCDNVGWLDITKYIK